MIDAVYTPTAVGRDRGPGSARLDSLDPAPFVAKTPDYKGWICLDFLGFSRPNRDLSMSYTGKTAEIFFARLFPGVKRAAGGAFGFSGGKRRITHEAKLTLDSDFLQSIVVRADPSSAASIKK
jgi:hypothetical protein